MRHIQSERSIVRLIQSGRSCAKQFGGQTSAQLPGSVVESCNTTQAKQGPGIFSKMAVDFVPLWCINALNSNRSE